MDWAGLRSAGLVVCVLLTASCGSSDQPENQVRQPTNPTSANFDVGFDMEARREVIGKSIPDSFTAGDETAAIQVEMLDRVEADVATYAKLLGLGESYLSYCQTKLSMETNAQPGDGMMPFGSNYRDLGPEALETVLLLREAYERSSLILCLSDTKAKLVLP